MLDISLIEELEKYNKNADPGESFYISECEDCGEAIFRMVIIPENNYHSDACLCGKTNQ
ncbi:hypothetical protein [Gottfriedia luciferensis]|uniref:hypothetical protein n=1 Tax=Gottfriedia luciferensis TaxID=178774 RepID=UPI0013021B4D|nr:hypothetical protein [Gottfriedia luciferensis]